VVGEICELRKQYVTEKEKQAALEDGAAYACDMRSEAARLTLLLTLQREQGGRLTHEFAAPRNVHRWQVLEVVNPGFVRQLRVRARLFDKLDKRHREEIDLQAEHKALEEKVAIRRARAPKVKSAECEEKIGKLKETLKLQSESLQEMKGQLEEIKAGHFVSSQVQEAQRLRAEKGWRLSVVSERTASRLEGPQEKPRPLFMTEVGFDFPSRLGGGFEKWVLPRGKLVKPKLIGKSMINPRRAASQMAAVSSYQDALSRKRTGTS
jgi:hypothetical protein